MSEKSAKFSYTFQPETARAPPSPVQRRTRLLLDGSFAESSRKSESRRFLLLSLLVFFLVFFAASLYPSAIKLPLPTSSALDSTHLLQHALERC